MVPTDLLDRLDALARTPLLLVACDYDGTLAEIVVDPAAAAPHSQAVAAFHTVGEAPWTSSAVVSGRSRADLIRFLGPNGADTLVGSHGAEWGTVELRLTADERARLEFVAHAIESIVDDEEGLRLERKPAAIALHVRAAEARLAESAIALAVERCGSLPGVHVRHGNQVVEFMVVNADKGEAVRRIRHSSGASAVLFVGDDLTDEDVFKSLNSEDVSIKIGPGETAARFRVDTVQDVATVLERVNISRRAWARARHVVKLDQCAVLSDQRTAAVVEPGARITWLCVPRLDSSAIFAQLVSDPGSGFFDISPAGMWSEPMVSYERDSFVLKTEWPGLKVTDYLDCSCGRAFQKPGRVDLVRVIEGPTRAKIRFVPRLDYGRIATRLKVIDDGLQIEGLNDPIVLRSPGVSWTISTEGVHHSAMAEVDAGAVPIVLELRYGSASMKPLADDEGTRRDSNIKHWAGWAASLRLPTVHRELVRRSALVIRSLSSGHSGTIAAAATTSLPELLGGTRNWDYRFCWPRDAALSAAALVQLGNTGQAMKFLDWMLEVVDECESPDRLHPIYTVSGHHLPPEAELTHLCGFAMSRPVRIGNAASNQVQLDVFGPIANLVAMLAERGAPVTPEQVRLVREMVRAVAARWQEPDHGIWEMRLERRHHVHSKVMCWHTVDRALHVEEIVNGTQNREWLRLRDAIRDDVLEHAWNPELETFTGAYGHTYPDASVLLIGLTGLVDGSDERFEKTVEYIGRELRNGPTVMRYRTDDGLPGGEGGMHICTGWLIESLVKVGRFDEATEMFEQFAGLIKGVGILTEQYDPVLNMALGNFAQAYSHLAFINAAFAIERAGVLSSRSSS
jgi:trehalose-phosphatase